MNWLAVGVGGALGSLARHAVSAALTRAGLSTVPLATALVNVVGCLTIGLLAGFVAHGRLSMTSTTRTFVFVGLLGGFTTFSSFGLDTLTLVGGGQRGLAAMNVLGQVGIGLGGVLAGFWLGTR